MGNNLKDGTEGRMIGSKDSVIDTARWNRTEI
jgi:hypothetical protein